MIKYATATSTRRNVHHLHRAGWRFLISAAYPSYMSQVRGWRYCLDNGAWTYHQRGQAFNDDAFRRAVDRYGSGADFVLAPDIVGAGHASLEMSLRWLPWLRHRTRRVLIPVQDGVVPDDLCGVTDERVGIAIGGSTAWKVAQLMDTRWRDVAPDAWIHVLRVNSARRIKYATLAGADSFDGTSASRFALSCGRLTRAAQQPILWRS